MSRKWKQCFVVFVFALISLNKTIFAMKRSREGTELEMNPADFEASGCERMNYLVNWNTFNAEKLIFKKQRVEDIPVKVKNVKNAKHFSQFLEGEDLLKYTLLHTRHKNFMECIPVTLSDRSGYVLWNAYARTVERVHLDREIMDFEMEKLNFVKDVFSRIPDTDSPTDYAFSFDTTPDYNKWFMLALHKRKNTIIRKQLEHVSSNNFQDYERIPVKGGDGSWYVLWDMEARTVESVHLLPIMGLYTEMLNFVVDVFSKIPDTDSPTDYVFFFDTTASYKKWFMLALHKQKNAIIGRQWEYILPDLYQTSNFEPCDAHSRWSSKHHIGQIFHWIKLHQISDGICKLLLANGFNFPLDRRNKKQKICENDIQCALKLKLDKSAKSLLLSYSDAKLTNDRYNIKDEDIKKAFRNNLCDSFTFMMESKNWPESLWRQALESKHQPSNEMMKLLLERIRASPEENHLDNLLKIFDKLMYLAGNVSISGQKHLRTCLLIFRISVRAQVYQRLLLFGVVKGDLPQCKFAVENGASLQERTSSRDAIAVANKFYWCQKDKKMYPRKQSLHTGKRSYLHPSGDYLLDNMTALEIAMLMEKPHIKLYLRTTECEKNKAARNKKEIMYRHLDPESDDDF